MSHILTRKHKIATESTNKNAENAEKYVCECGKIYNDRSGLWRHKKNCNNEAKNEEEKEKEKEEDDDIATNSTIIMEILKHHQTMLEKNTSENNNSLIIELLKQNQDFKNLMIEQNKYMLAIAKNAGTNNCNNTTNNTKFNMQFFLNETCKNAMSITEFVDSLELTFEDLENVGRVGYAEGISQIFIKGIRATEVCKRPIHCSDIKRVVMFINDINGWEKDSNSNEKIIRLIKQIAKKNMKQASIWISQHQHIVHGHGSREQNNIPR